MANCWQDDQNKNNRPASWKKSKDEPPKTTLLAEAWYTHATNDTKTTSTTIETTVTTIETTGTDIKTTGTIVKTTGATLSKIINSGSSNHMTGERSTFKTVTLVRQGK